MEYLEKSHIIKIEAHSVDLFTRWRIIFPVKHYFVVVILHYKTLLKSIGMLDGKILHATPVLRLSRLVWSVNFSFIEIISFAHWLHSVLFSTSIKLDLQIYLSDHTLCLFEKYLFSNINWKSTRTTRVVLTLPYNKTFLISRSIDDL